MRTLKYIFVVFCASFFSCTGYAAAIVVDKAEYYHSESGTVLKDVTSEVTGCNKLFSCQIDLSSKNMRKSYPGMDLRILYHCKDEQGRKIGEGGRLEVPGSPARDVAFISCFRSDVEKSSDAGSGILSSLSFLSPSALSIGIRRIVAEGSGYRQVKTGKVD